MLKDLGLEGCWLDKSAEGKNTSMSLDLVTQAMQELREATLHWRKFKGQKPTGNASIQTDPLVVGQLQLIGINDESETMKAVGGSKENVRAESPENNKRVWLDPEAVRHLDDESYAQPVLKMTRRALKRQSIPSSGPSHKQASSLP